MTTYLKEGRGKLNEGEGSVQLTSSLRLAVLYKKVNEIFNIKRSLSKLVSTRRSTVLNHPKLASARWSTVLNHPLW